MVLRLPPEAQTAAGIIGINGRAVEWLDLHAGSASSLQFAIENVERIARRHKQVTVNAREVAVDLLLADNALDLIDGSAVALGREAHAFLAVRALQLREAISHDIGEVRRGAAGFSAPDRTVIHHHHIPAFAA